MLLNSGVVKSDGTPLHFGCAFIAGIAMTIASAPFDLLKTRVLADASEGGARLYKGMVDAAFKTVRNEGFLALYKGFV